MTGVPVGAEWDPRLRKVIVINQVIKTVERGPSLDADPQSLTQLTQDTPVAAKTVHTDGHGVVALTVAMHSNDVVLVTVKPE
jgi:hypothetical protein